MKQEARLKGRHKGREVVWPSLGCIETLKGSEPVIKEAPGGTLVAQSSVESGEGERETRP
jgi:hypothetical protein